MSVLSAVFLGLIQGVAEFLPISSSGHLAVLQNVFHLNTAEEGHMFFDVLLHLGTMIAIVAAYWSDIVYIVRDTVGLLRQARGLEEPARQGYPGSRLLLLMFFGTLPLFIVLPFNDLLEELYYKTWFIGIAFLLNGCILYISDRIPSGRKNERSMRVRDALVIGLCQAVATIPGISRSGTTITAGLVTGQERTYAMKFSLLLSLPAVFGANLLSLFDAIGQVDAANMPAYLLGTLTAMIVGYFSIVLLRRLVQKRKFGNFAYYMWGAGLFTLIVSLF